MRICSGQESLKILSVDVVSGIRMRFATTKVRTVVENLGHTAQQYNFVSYLPDNAYITNFTM